MSDLEDLEAMWALSVEAPEPPRVLRSDLDDREGCGPALLLAVLAALVVVLVGAVILVWLAVRWAVTS